MAPPKRRRDTATTPGPDAASPPPTSGGGGAAGGADGGVSVGAGGGGAKAGVAVDPAPGTAPVPAGDDVSRMGTPAMPASQQSNGVGGADDGAESLSSGGESSDDEKDGADGDDAGGLRRSSRRAVRRRTEASDRRARGRARAVGGTASGPDDGGGANGAAAVTTTTTTGTGRRGGRRGAAKAVVDEELSHLHVSRLAKRKPRPVKEEIVPHLAVVFDLANDPCVQYCLQAVADSGLDTTQWTSYRLKTHALYFETRTARYEISRQPNLSPDGYDLYTVSQVLIPHRLDLSVMKGLPVPLPSWLTEVVAFNLDWSQFCWSDDGVVIQGYSPMKPLNVRFVPYTSASNAAVVSQVKGWLTQHA